MTSLRFFTLLILSPNLVQCFGLSLTDLHILQLMEMKISKHFFCNDLIRCLPRHKSDGLNRLRVQMIEDCVQHVGVPQHLLPGLNGEFRPHCLL